MGTQISSVEIEQAKIPLPALDWPGPYARFGNFLLDTRREELYRDGRRIRVQAKVFQALVMLVTRVGEIVTREDVRKRVWPDSLPSSLDANVNTAMNKLRQLLGDSSDAPIYIETIPRRGYCFIAAVEFSDVIAPSAKPAISTEGPTDAVSPKGKRSLLHYVSSTPFHLVSLVLAGMLLGALIVLAWSS